MNGNTNPLDQAISKSLDELEAIVKSHTNDLSKAQDDEDLAPEDVSQDAPEDNDQDSQPDAQDTPEDDAQDDAPDGDQDEDPEMEKSLAGVLGANENVRKALEVSEFLSETVTGIDVVLKSLANELRGDLSKSVNAQEGALVKTIEGLSKSLRPMVEMQVQLAKSMETLNKRLSKVESQPAARKSVANATQAHVVAKSFAGTPNASQSNTLSKSEALSKLSVAFEQGNHGVGSDIMRLEAGVLPNELSAVAKSVLGI